MSYAYFITHPEVSFDWAVPVPEWDLSELGRDRLEATTAQPWVRNLGKLFASPERKTITTAQRLAAASGAEIHYLPALAEIDRSAAGTLPPDEYNRVTKEFFAKPSNSARGWERAIHAQRRIVKAVNAILEDPALPATIAVISHGGVGTLLLCHLRGVPIRRSEDQPGQGHYFVFDCISQQVQHGWRRIDTIEQQSPQPDTQ
jgi:broad specificity phosphatase PhoE